MCSTPYICPEFYYPDNGECKPCANPGGLFENGFRYMSNSTIPMDEACLTPLEGNDDLDGQPGTRNCDNSFSEEESLGLRPNIQQKFKQYQFNDHCIDIPSTPHEQSAFVTDGVPSCHHCAVDHHR